MGSTVIVEMKNITKKFGAVVANEDVSFEVKKGEIHGLLGENGAGKSTLMNMLSGIYTPDSGSIYIKGDSVYFTSPRQAISKGIGMVYQHFKLVDKLSARDNIVAGEKGGFWVGSKKVTQKIEGVCKKFGISFELQKKVMDMSVSEKQRLEIIKVLYRGADILVLDEPTAVLTPQEVERLFKIIRGMKEQGCAVIIITHKLHEIMEICDRVTVLRKGKSVKTLDIKEATPGLLTELMVGYATDLSITRPGTKNVKPVYEVKGLSIVDKEKIKVVNNVSFTMNSGEILGIAGIAGSGQKELCEAMAGLCKIDSGELIYKGEDIKGYGPREIFKKGIRISFVPEDRLGMGLVGSMDIVDNMLIKDYHTQKGIFLKRSAVRHRAKGMVKELQIKTPGVHHSVKMLSGGNIQKVLIGREINSKPDVLIAAYAVRGLDIGATHQIYDLINEQKNRGVAILYVGEDLDVLLQLCDRILVMCDGAVTGLVDAKSTTKEEVGLLMAGEAVTIEEGKGNVC